MADPQITPSSMARSTALERFHLSPDDDRADRIVPSDPVRATTTLRGLAPDVGVRVMALLVDAGVTDGCVAPAEHALLLAAAATIGIDAGALEERIARRLASRSYGAVHGDHA